MKKPQGGAVWFLKEIKSEYRGEKSTVLRARKESSCCVISMSAQTCTCIHTHTHTARWIHTNNIETHRDRQIHTNTT